MNYKLELQNNNSNISNNNIDLNKILEFINVLMMQLVLERMCLTLLLQKQTIL